MYHQKTFSYKYVSDSSHVFVPTVKKSSMKTSYPLYDRRTLFLTEPFIGKDHPTVLVAFLNERMVEYKLPKIIQNYRSMSTVAELEQIRQDDLDYDMLMHMSSVKDLKSHGDLIGLPVIIYMNAYCTMERTEHYEIFFHHNKHPDTFSNFKIDKNID